jgi:hypothetical protein
MMSQMNDKDALSPDVTTLRQSESKHDWLGVPVKAHCACGETWVFVGWPMRPCGGCRQGVTLDPQSLAEWQESRR